MVCHVVPAYQVFVAIDVDGTDDCEGFLGLVVEGPRLLHLGLEPVAHAAVLAFERGGHAAAQMEETCLALESAEGRSHFLPRRLEEGAHRILKDVSLNTYHRCIRIQR